MIKLGKLTISTKAGLKDARDKVHDMAMRFGFNGIQSVRFATILTELVDPAVLTGVITREISVQLIRDEKNGICIVADLPEQSGVARLAARFFDAVEMVATDGETCQFQGFKQFPTV